MTSFALQKMSLKMLLIVNNGSYLLDGTIFLGMFQEVECLMYDVLLALCVKGVAEYSAKQVIHKKNPW